MRRSGLKPPTPEQVARWRAKPRRALPRGERPARQGRRAKREEKAWQIGRAAVVERSGGFCEGPHIPFVHPAHLTKHPAQHVHHVVPRGRGGNHDPENLIHLCWQLHEWAHHHPDAAEQFGLLKSKII